MVAYARPDRPQTTWSNASHATEKSRAAFDAAQVEVKHVVAITGLILAATLAAFLA